MIKITYSTTEQSWQNVSPHFTHWNLQAKIKSYRHIEKNNILFFFSCQPTSNCLLAKGATETVVAVVSASFTVKFWKAKT
jgi:hypothetical protein